MAAFVLFVGGLAVLLTAAHFVVRGGSDLGARFGLSPLVIGLTIVASGTSAPELAVVGQAVAVDDTELAVGSIIGSNIANILLVLGLVATLGTIHVTSRVVRIDIPLMIAASVLFLVFALDGRLGRLDGAVLFTGVVVFVVWTLRNARRAGAVASVGDGEARPRSMATSIAQLVGGIVGLTIAAGFVVRGAEELAVSLGVPELVVGLTIVAIGTSAPEIVTTLVAAFKGQRDIAVGNAVGSNIFNILLVLGSASLFAPGGIAVSDDAVQLDLPVMVATAVACLPIVAWDNRLNRWEGVVFLAYYAAFVTFVVLDGTGHGARDPFALVMVGFVIPLTVITVATVIHRQRRLATLGRPTGVSNP